jgi:serine/threonine protein kinase
MANSAPPPADPLIGRVIAGKFAVDQRLGAGAMGIVYRARQLALERTVAVKVMHREFAADPEFADRFWREAKAASRLDHPNSIRVFDFGQEPDGLLYLAMEYVEGSDLFDWLAPRRPVAPGSVVEILSQVLAALAVAHDMGVVHRDLKPENILVVRGKSDDGRLIDVVKVCDFGIAKLLDMSAASASASPEHRRKHSTSGLIVGTPAYMSPEQARGERQDARSDLYAVGIILYELLAGRVPFEAETLIGVALKHVSEPPERPSAHAPGVDPALEAICLKAISKKPADRYQNAREMRVALQSVASGYDPGRVHAPVAVGASAAPLAPLHRHDSSKPTFVGLTPGTPAQPRSRAWLALLLVPALSGALLVYFRSSLIGVPSGVEPVLSASPLPSSDSASPSAAVPEPMDSNAPAEVASAPRHASGPNRHYVKGEVSARSAAAQDTHEALAGPSPVVPSVTLEPVPPPTARTLVPLVPPPTVAPPPVPVAPKYDLTLARVTIGTARNAVGTTAASVTRAVAQAASRITACYKSALPQLGGSFEGADVLHVDTDGAGLIIDARLSGPLRGNLAACVAAAVQGHRVANVDTGNASGDVPLSFQDH